MHQRVQRVCGASGGLGTEYCRALQVGDNAYPRIHEFTPKYIRQAVIIRVRGGYINLGQTAIWDKSD